MKALHEIGFSEMTPIQEASIPTILSNQDFIGQSETGSGKTAAFAIPVLQKLKGYEAFPQALILCPTRELCDQILQECRRFAKYLESIKIVLTVGGQPIVQQIEALKKGSQLIIGTPGRTLELIKSGKADVSKLKILVLDEADRLLEDGFAAEMKEIFDKIPKSRQTIFFSATFPKSIEELSRKHQKNPKKVLIEKTLQSENKNESFYYEAETPEKVQTLLEVLRQHPSMSTLIFCRTKAMVDELGQFFKKVKISSDVLHSDLSQSERDRTTALFRNGSIRILIATDIAARGLDHDLLELVVNFDFPATPDVYIHRSGRTGRNSRSGTVVSIVTSTEAEMIPEVELLAGQKLIKKSLSFDDQKPLNDSFQTTLFRTIQLAVGRKDKITTDEIIQFFSSEPNPISNTQLGRIEIQEDVTYIAISPVWAQPALDKLVQLKFKNSLKRNSDFLRLL